MFGSEVSPLLSKVAIKITCMKLDKETENDEIVEVKIQLNAERISIAGCFKKMLRES